MAQSQSKPPVMTDERKEKLSRLKQREHNSQKVKEVIKLICKEGHVKAYHIAEILDKREDYIKRKYLGEMIKEGELQYLYPEMINHPSQAYKTRK